MEEKDVFICHASEDKESVVRQLSVKLAEAGITYWLDEEEIPWGHSIVQKVNEGLQKSRFVLVVLSPVFLHKPWPQRELNIAINQEASNGVVRVLPLLVGNVDERKQIMDMYQLLGDKRYLVWNGAEDEVVSEMSRLLSKGKTEKPKHSPMHNSEVSKVYMPIVKKEFTQLDKDLFLRDSYQVIKEYFRVALSQLKSKYTEIDTDIDEETSKKFSCKIYVNGNTKCQCKIGIGGLSSNDSITY